MFLGYSRDHGSGVFRFLNIKTRKIIHSRDVKWIDKKYGDYLDEKQIKQKSNGIFYGLDDEREYFTSGRDVEGEISNQNLQPGNNLEEDNTPVKEEENNNLNPKVRRALRMFENSYNRTMESMAYAFVGGTYYDYDRNKWRTAILKELNDIISRKVWRNVKTGDVPKNRRLIGSKWVFKVKKDRTFRARLCAIGYSQIAGIDYTDNFAPVVNDVTFRTDVSPTPMTWLCFR